MQGKGCGDPTRVDCMTSDPNFNLEVRPCALQSCSYSNSYRPNENTIMHDESQNPYRYGPVNERLLCDKIIEKTRKAVSGVC